MKKLLIIYIFLLSWIFALEPIVTLDADKKNIYPGEKVNITLSVTANKDDEKKIKFVHQETLNGEKIIKRAGKDSYDTVADGDKTIDIVQKDIIYTIAPKKDIKIPPLPVFIGDKEYKTNSLKIKIIKDKVDNKIKAVKKVVQVKKERNIKKSIKISLKANKKSLTIYEPFIVTESIIQPLDVPIRDINYKKPVFNGFKLIKSIKKEGQIKDSLITKIDYILVPQKAGSLKILPAKISFALDVTPAIASPFGFFNTQNQIETVSSNALKIKVSPVPKGVDIVGNYKIETKINKKIAKKDEQIVYVVTIKGEGNLEELELPKLKIDDVTIYQDEPKIRKELIGNKFLTIYEQKYVFIAQNSFTIPAIEIKAYSPRFKKVYRLSTKPIDILINNISNKKIAPIESEVKNNFSKEKKDKNLKLILDTKYYEKKLKEAESKVPLIIAFIAGLILGIFGVIFIPKLFRYIKLKNEKTPLYSSYEEALHILYPHTTKGKEYEAMVTILYEVINGNKDLKVDNKKLNKLIKKVINKK